MEAFFIDINAGKLLKYFPHYSVLQLSFTLPEGYSPYPFYSRQSIQEYLIR